MNEKNNLENTIKSIIEEKLHDGTVEKVIASNFEKALNNAVAEMFSYGREGKILLENKVKETMIPIIETFDFSKYLTNLDTLLSQIVNTTEVNDNMKILNNFRDLLKPMDKNTEATVTDIFYEFKNYVSKNVDTSYLGVEFDDGAQYESVDISFKFEQIDKPYETSYFERAILTLSCAQDEEMNFEIPLTRYINKKDDSWEAEYKTTKDMYSLKYLSDFEIYITRLTQAGCKIVIDIESGEEMVIPEKEPESTYY